MTSRSHWVTAVNRAGDAEDENDDVAFWLQIPQEERAAATWALSLELFALAERNGGVFDPDTGLRVESRATDERRFPRTAFSVSRR
jgi:hypothetical protein